MADGMNQDVVAGRLQFDVSKILPTFRMIDKAVEQNAQSFRALNQIISVAEKNYKSLSQSMDRMALGSDERRKKVLDESNALVAQRTAQTELLRAKTESLNKINQVTDSKLQAQEAIVKRRNTAIEQQEKEHQQKMVILQQRATTASGQENLVQARIDREFQLTRSHHSRMEQQAQLHAARMARLNQDSSRGLEMSSQYLLLGTMYYTAVREAKEAISVIKDFEYTLVSLQRVMGDTADIGIVKEHMISDAKEYGYALKEIGQVYVSVAQQGFNEQDTSALAKTALMAANVEQSFTGAAQAQDLMTGAILNYRLEAQESERLLDRLNEVSNNFATNSNKLLQGINRAGASAKNANVPINELIGYLTVLNQAGFSGSVAGNAIKSFISFSSRDSAIEKLEKYVGTIKQASGEMMPFSVLLDKLAAKWYDLSDAERHEVTQAVARGDQASRFIAIMDNYDKVVDVATTAENSFGSAQRENALTMSTLEKQSMQLKASWDELVITMGDNGLLAVLKEIVNFGRLLVDGFNSLPDPIKNTLTAVLLLGGAILTLNTGVRLLTGTSLTAMVMGLVNGARAMLGLKTATDAANLSQKAFVATPLGATLTAVSIAIGVATTAWALYSGSQNEANSATRQNDRDTYALAQKYSELKSIVDDNTRSDKEIKQAKDELSLVIEKISSLMPGLISQWDAHGRAIDVNIEKLGEWKQKYAESLRLVENKNIQDLTQKRNELQGKIDRNQDTQRNLSEEDLSFWDRVKGSSVEDKRTQIAGEILEDGQELAKIDQQLKNSQSTLDAMDGKNSKAPEKNKKHGGRQKTDEQVAEEYQERKNAFTSKMNEFRHLVNMQADGYRDAKGQAEKLKAIKSQFGDMSEEDLYGIDEELHRLGQGKAVKAKGLGGSSPKPKAPPAFKFPLDGIDGQVKQAQMAIESASNLISFFDAKSATFAKSVDTSSTRLELYRNHQNKLHESNKSLRESLSQLQTKQKELNSLYSSGKISLEDYNKHSENVTTRIASVTKEVDSNAAAWWRDLEAIQQVKDKLLTDSLAKSEEFIRHYTAMGQMSAQGFYDAWMRIQSRYDPKSKSETERDLRKKADEQVYAAKKALLQEEDKTLKQKSDKEQKIADDLLKSHKKRIQDAKKAELDAIQQARDKFLEAQEEKIKAIDQQIAKMQEANDEQDYESKLAEKRARLELLQSAVGPDGIKERGEVAKEIERMQLEHDRLLTKRGLESQKKKLEEEKQEREKAFDAEKQAANDKYDVLLQTFDEFKDDVSKIEDAIKQFRISSNQEANKTILAELDAFLAEYKAKMAYITSANATLGMSEKERDLQRYNANIDKWNAGDAKTKAEAHDENVALRNKYGITKDTGKLQKFKTGGIVQGVRNEEVPVIAHAQEMVLNDYQQGNLFKLLNMSLPSLKMATPSFAMASGESYDVTNHYTVSNVVHLHDDADIDSFYSGADSLVRRFQSRAGVRPK
ncbi:phage tail tape measure protein [Paenibacillus sp. UMB4589-SE434]|uniref:phage tail tape measure protein n=1 Tax=Paenibacillus sp. UMB4589-SE434 TaxID=3046314 RepID=UPI00254CE4D2|nr:phage tail tape measure protein [Paenibacillus sp. UMB4589-SE434]MDK8182117.1 phage tail tape measure protein [Paenibacillus sp. UMB4589-SE434]